MYLRYSTFTLVLFSLISLVVEGQFLAKYHCGVGKVSKALSYLASSACGRERLNKCCLQHDRCYDVNKGAEELVLRTCDTNFEECIEWGYKRSSWFCAKFLQFTHSGAIRLFGGLYRNVFGYDPTTIVLMNDPLFNDTEANQTMRIGRVIRAERLTLLNVTKIE